MTGLLPVDEALRRLVLQVGNPTPSESVAVGEAVGRVLAEPLIATRTQPPFPASAMDGYAVRASDLAIGAGLRLVGASAAGHAFDRRLSIGEAVRIFTGAPVPDGADTILIQENAQVTGDHVFPLQVEPAGRFVRKAGGDFAAGQSFFSSGHRLRPTDMALAASLGGGVVSVRRRPRVAVLATGDELVLPGETPAADQIISGNHLAVSAIAEKAGAATRQLGIARDSIDGLRSAIDHALAWQADVLVTIGGASVGEHDLVQNALTQAGMALEFWRIAMRPGKPLMSGMLGRMHVLGLPGNPASAVVCSHLFLRPLIAALLGQPGADPSEAGRLGRDLGVNDERQDYLRAALAPGLDGLPTLTPLAAQDSALTSVLAAADALVVRPPHAPPAVAGDPCRFIRLD